jgi:hypothetical protein
MSGTIVHTTLYSYAQLCQGCSVRTPLSTPASHESRSLSTSSGTRTPLLTVLSSLTLHHRSSSNSNSRSSGAQALVQQQQEEVVVVVVATEMTLWLRLRGL